MKHAECDKLVSLIDDGDRSAIVQALCSGIPFAAFRAILQAGYLKLSGGDIVRGAQLWQNCEIEMLGRPMKAYARALLYSFGEIDSGNAGEEERAIASVFAQ